TASTSATGPLRRHVIREAYVRCRAAAARAAARRPSVAAFGAVRAPLERQATVYALDRRGHGDSEDVPGWAPGCEYEDIAAVAAAVVPAPVALVGHSFGALCALEAAAERVDELVRAPQPEAALDAVLAGVEHHGPRRWSAGSERRYSRFPRSSARR